jgi:anti-sigma factor ChrR (cupin superfamily)
MRSGPTELEELLGLATSEDVTPEVQRLEEAMLALQRADDAAPSPDLWAKIAAKIDQDEAAPGTATITAGEGVWERVAPGVDRKVVHVDRTGGIQSYFVRMTEGAVMPGHEHHADEHCVVMQGELEIGGAIYAGGTYHFAGRGIPHLPIIARSDALLFIHGEL